MSTPPLPIAAVCAALGGQAELSRKLRVTPAAVNQWCRQIRPVPESQCRAIERLMDGAVTCEQLRADVHWIRIKDSEWKWHKAGRPLIDTSVSTAKEAA